MADAALARTSWGIVVRSASGGDTLYALNPGKLLLPASTLKIVTLAATADRLGWDFQYRTRVFSSGTIENGVLNGDLVIAGSGDPSLDDWDGAASEVFAGWAQDLERAGIRRIAGRIVGDDHAFDAQGLGSGWAWDDLSASYAAPVGGLQFNENTARITVAPGEAPGDPALAKVDPDSAPLTVRNRVTTSPAGSTASLQIRAAAPVPTLELRGAVPAGNQPVVRAVSVPNPTVYFANAVRLALIRNGIAVDGPAVDLDDLSDPPSLQTGTTSFTDSVSPPLHSLAGTMMKMSQNLFAETLVKTLGGVMADSGSTEAGLGVVRSVLNEWNIPEKDVVMADGSGLSRYNLATPDAMASVLLHVYRDPRLRDPFMEALPVAGVDGTLAERMRGTTAAGNARAKTGSMSGVRALAGYVRSADDEPMIFVIVANNYGGDSKAVDQAGDAVVAALARFTRR